MVMTYNRQHMLAVSCQKGCEDEPDSRGPDDDLPFHESILPFVESVRLGSVPMDNRQRVLAVSCQKGCEDQPDSGDPDNDSPLHESILLARGIAANAPL